MTKTAEHDVHPLNPNPKQRKGIPFPSDNKNMNESLHFNRERFAKQFSTLKEDGCFDEDIPQEELVRIFAEAISTDTPEDEVFKSITSIGHYDGLESDCDYDDLEYIEDDFDEYDDLSEYDEYESFIA